MQICIGPSLVQSEGNLNKSSLAPVLHLLTSPRGYLILNPHWHTRCRKLRNNLSLKTVVHLAV